MERLTGRKEGGHAYIVGCPDFEIPKIIGLIIQNVVDRLAAYEDTELEPEEIAAISGLASENCAKTADKIDQLLSEDKDLEEYRALGPIDRLRELAQADREGRCVVLPIKPGTPVWSTVFCQLNDDGTEHPTYPWPFELSMADEWGRGWFLTREEAEAALRREQDG